MLGFLIKKAARPTAHARRAVAANPSVQCQPAGESERSLDLARTMLKAAVASFREEVRKGACEERVQEARAVMVFWRERMEALLREAQH